MRVAATVTGVDSIIGKLKRFLHRQEVLPLAVLESEAPGLEAEIFAQTPKDTGQLEQSVDVTVYQLSGSKCMLWAKAHAFSPTGYDYSDIQHDNEAFHHPVKGKAHYISDPFQEAVERIEDRLGTEVTYD